MNQQPFAGNLSEIAFPALLVRLWKQKKSGLLSLRHLREEKKFRLERGNFVLLRESFPEENFLKFLVSKKILTAAQRSLCEKQAQRDARSLLWCLTELDMLSPSRLWLLMETFLHKEAFAAFDWPEAEFSLAAGYIQEEYPYQTGLHTLNLVLRGVRRMNNFELIAARLPAGAESIQAYAPRHLDLLRLLPHEQYVLRLLAEPKTLQDVYSLSELSRKETQRVLFAFLCLGIAGPPGTDAQVRPTPDFSLIESEKIMGAFREKCLVIYKYISKEIGPVAASLIGKCLEEVNSWLGPNLPRIELNPDGTFEFKAALRLNPDLFLNVIEELLSAEVLMVKRTLGSEHEAALVKALEKAGTLH
ncbi:MAG: DUF4388 domain-containing protein [Candidatus Aminicenantes bacterium]|nr:DUF4388 domain-containing protein [Candidatus Aminicenantes bacterium]